MTAIIIAKVLCREPQNTYFASPGLYTCERWSGTNGKKHIYILRNWQILRNGYER
jgi:hypothetical protein